MTRILIAGSGIAGLTTALALHARDLHDVTILEQSPRIWPLGSGLNLMPQATRCFAELGVLDDLRRVAIATSTMQLATSRGRVLWSEARDQADQPQLSIHRGRLTRVLAEQVATRLGPHVLRPGARLLTANPEQRIAAFARPDRTTFSLDFDVLIGADGIRSATRGVVLGAPVPLRHAGATVWRGVTRYPSFADGATMVIAGDGRCKVVFYPIAHDGDDGCLMNWAAATPTHDDGPRGEWNTIATADLFAGEFAGWRIHGVDVEHLMRVTKRPFAYPMVDIDPLPGWTRGPITLIGDAAHAMYPIGSNGATQSVIDALSLARHLTAAENPEAGLSTYESERRPATRAIQIANRARGPEIVIDLAAQRAPDGFTDLDEIFAPGELDRIARRYALVSGAPAPTAPAPTAPAPDAPVHTTSVPDAPIPSRSTR